MVRPATTRSSAVSPSNVTSDLAQSLQAFDLLDLQQYTPERAYSSTASKDFHLFFVGRDNVHDVLKHVLSRARVSLYLNMFGYDDDELNEILMAKATDPKITMLIAAASARRCWTPTNSMRWRNWANAQTLAAQPRHAQPQCRL